MNRRVLYLTLAGFGLVLLALLVTSTSSVAAPSCDPAYFAGDEWISVDTAWSDCDLVLSLGALYVDSDTTLTLDNVVIVEDTQFGNGAWPTRVTGPGGSIDATDGTFRGSFGQSSLVVEVGATATFDGTTFESFGALFGEGVDSQGSLTITDAQFTDATWNAVSQEGGSLDIERTTFSMTGPTVTIVAIGSVDSPTFNDNTLTDSFGSWGSALYISDSTSPDVRGNTFTNGGDIVDFDGISTDLTFSDNIFNGLLQSSAATFTGLDATMSVEGNNVGYSSDASGFAFYGTYDLIFRNNTIDQGLDGSSLELYGFASVDIDHIDDNVLVGSAGCCSAAIYVSKEDWQAQLVGNQVEDASGTGLLVDAGSDEDITLTVIDSSFSGNAEGISIYDGAVDLTIIDSTLDDNFDGSGLYLYTEGGPVTISGSSLSSNDGTSLYLDGDDLELALSGTDVSDNDGHGVYVNAYLLAGGPATFDSTSIDNNDGWGVYFSDVASADFTDTTLSTNNNGGISCNDDCTLSLTGSTIEWSDGQGIDVDGALDLTLDGTSISDNWGSGIRGSPVDLTATDSHVDRNQNSGVASQSSTPSSIGLDGTTIDGNYNANIRADNYLTLDMLGSSLSDSIDGDGLYTTDGVSIDLTDSALSGNSGSGVLAPTIDGVTDGTSFDDNGYAGLFGWYSLSLSDLVDSTLDGNGEYGLRADEDLFLSSTGSSISGNDADGVYGGWDGDVWLVLSDVIIDGNGADGIDLYSSGLPFDLELTDCSVSDNDGYGVYLDGSANSDGDYLFDGTTIDDNNGNGVYFGYSGAADDNRITITDSSFSSNQGYGFLVHGDDNSFDATDSAFDGNDGTGLRLGEYALVSLSGGSFDDNTDGNGADLSYGPEVTVDGTSFSGNNDDGMRISEVTALDISDATFDGNQDSGLSLEGGPGLSTQVTLSDSSFSGNDDEGLYIEGWGWNLLLSSVTVTDNNGHGVDLPFSGSDAILTIQGSTIDRNSGTGVYLDSDWGALELSIDATSFSANDDHGLYLYSTTPDGPFTIDDSTFDDNGASGLLTSYTHADLDFDCQQTTFDGNGEVGAYFSSTRTDFLLDQDSFSDNGNAGLYASNGNGNTHLSIDESAFDGNGWIGFYNPSGAFNAIDDNTITDSSFSRNGDSGFYYASGGNPGPLSFEGVEADQNTNYGLTLWSLPRVAFNSSEASSNGGSGLRAELVWDDFVVQDSALDFNGGDGLWLAHVYGSVHDNSLSGNGGSGAWSQYGELRYENNTISGAGSNGITTNWDWSAGMVIANNVISGAQGNGIAAYYPSGNVAPVQIFGNSISVIGGSGIYLPGSGYDDDVLLFDNDISDVNGQGIYVEYLREALIYDNTLDLCSGFGVSNYRSGGYIQDNQFTNAVGGGIRAELWGVPEGDYALRGFGYIIANNDITNNKAVGIQTYGTLPRAPMLITQNLVRGGEEGIRNDESDSGHLLISDNDVSLASVGISVHDSRGVDLEDNTLSLGSIGIGLYYLSDVVVARNYISTYQNTGLNGYSVQGTIRDNLVRTSNYGLSMNYLSGDVTNNTVLSCYVAMDISYTLGTFADNTIAHNLNGILFHYGSVVTLEDGVYTDNTYEGVRSDDQTFVFWHIIDGASVDESPMEFSANITIDGPLTMSDSSLRLRPLANDGLGIVIGENGSMTLRDVGLWSSNGNSFQMTVLPGGSLDAQGCTFEDLGSTSELGRAAEGGLLIRSADVTLDDVSFESGDGGIVVDGVTVIFDSISISDSDGDDVVARNGADVTLRGASFDHDKAIAYDTSVIRIDFRIDVWTFDDSWDALPGVTVDITDVSSGQPQGDTLVTDAQGHATAFLLGAIIDATGETPAEAVIFDIDAAFGGQTQSERIVLDEDREVEFDFGTAPTVRPTAPTEVEVVEGGMESLDIELIFADNDGLWYDWRSITAEETGEGGIDVGFGGSRVYFWALGDFDGQEDIELMAFDSHGLQTNHTIHVRVIPVNDRPELEELGTITIDEDESFFLDVAQYLWDPDNSLDELDLSSTDARVAIDGSVAYALFPQAGHFVVTLTVTDLEGLSDSVDVDFVVRPVDDPPRFVPMGTIALNESEAYLLDLTTLIIDEDTPLDDIIVSTTSPYVLSIDGLRYTFLFPEGVSYHEAVFTASDGTSNGTGRYRFTVEPVNSPPVWVQIPVQTVLEDQMVALDLAPYVSDIDGPLELSLTTDTGTLTGQVLSVAYDTGGVYQVQVTAFDGELRATATLVIQVTEANDPPVLSDPKSKVDAQTGMATFEVTVTDPDSADPTVWVVVNGVRIAMERISGTTADGAVYRAKVQLKPGQNSWYFEVDDNEGETARTATTGGGSVNVAQATSAGTIAALLLLVIALVALGYIAYRTMGGGRKRGGADL